MSKTWWSKKAWRIRDNTGLEAFFDIGDTFKLAPGARVGKPAFFRIRFKIGDPTKALLWKDCYFYDVGVKSPSTSLKHCWDDDKVPGAQDQHVKADFDRETRHLHQICNDPKTRRLEGYIRYNSYWAIIRIFCFLKAQSDGRDWFALDSSYDQLSLAQDGTAHGDPPH